MIAGREIGRDRDDRTVAARRADTPSPARKRRRHHRDPRPRRAHDHGGGDVFVTSKGPSGPVPRDRGRAAPTVHRSPTIAVRSSERASIDRPRPPASGHLTIARAFAEAVRPENGVLRASLRELRATLESLSPNLVGVAGLGASISALGRSAHLRDVGLGGDAGVRPSRDDRRHPRDARPREGRSRHAWVTRRRSSPRAAARARPSSGSAAADHRRVELAIERIRGAIDKVDPLLAKMQDLSAPSRAAKARSAC